MKYFYFLAALFVCNNRVTAQQTAEKFVQELHYYLYLPQDYNKDSSTRFPLMVFLHGSGESGDDLAKVKTHGPPKLIEQGRKFPFIVVSPQAPPNRGWEVEMLNSMLEDLKKKYRVDADRVYLTGLSMGGFGTWNWAEKHPYQFAAIAPICGGGDATKAWTLRHIPTWCFHGAKDDVVLPSASQAMVDSLGKYNKHVKFTLYPEANHNSWDTTYNTEALYTWLLQQKRFRYTETKADPSALKAFTGQFKNDEGHNVELTVENNVLTAKVGNEKTALKQFEPGVFFIGEDIPVEVQFHKNNKGLADYFIILQGDRKSFFNRLPETKPAKK